MTPSHPSTSQLETGTDAPALSSLGPSYDPDLHGRHANILFEILTDRATRPVKNVALAGHYGSGKSSVLLGVQKKLDDQGVKWVNLSMSSLGVGDSARTRVQQDGTLPPLTNLIQKEIVKQLLYRKAPADMPGSRYFRIDSFRAWPAIVWSVLAAVCFFMVAVLVGLVGRVADVAPSSLVDGQEWPAWAIVAALAVFVGVIWFLALRSLQHRLRVESVSAGGAAVSLSAKENSYFDEYLDEIVYFFQRTRTEIAIFEDLDRFKDPHIFETLRELNTVLNNSEQVKAQPVRFVYAVRDSIFEQLEESPFAVDEADLAPANRASILESAPAANRTKFFDLVVPMVPFITHRSARDLLAAEFAVSSQRPSAEVIGLVGAYLTDMRLIRNIRNEFDIYRASVLRSDGLEGLTADRLFAMMVYKNLHLDDFEAVRLGASRIDEAYRTFRAMVDHQVDHQAGLRRAALQRAASPDLWGRRAEAAGQRLARVLPVLGGVMSFRGDPFVQLEGKRYELEELTSQEFWKSLYDSREPVVVNAPGAGPTRLSFDDVVILVGESAETMDVAVDADARRYQRTADVAAKTRDFVSNASMAQLIARTDLRMPTDDGDGQSLASVVRELVSPLAFELLSKGYIDENFTLYCSDYHTVSVSKTAMNFILHSVQKNRADYRFHFDDPSSIDAIEREMGDRFLSGTSVFNTEVFDHYLSTNPERLSVALGKLEAGLDEDTSFLDAYLEDGSEADDLVFRLAGRWRQIFVYLVEGAPLEFDALVSLLSNALIGVDGELNYASSEEVARMCSEFYAQIDAFVNPDLGVERSRVIVSVAQDLGVRFEDLSLLGEPQRSSAARSELYPVNRNNLAAAFGAEGVIPLDVMRERDERIYGRVVESVAEYLDALAQDEVAVSEPEGFLPILFDVAEQAESMVARFLDNVSDRCELDHLANVDESAWPAVVSSGRFAPTASNLDAFVTSFGVTEELVDGLGGREITAVDDVEADDRDRLACAFANSGQLGDDALVESIRQLGLSAPLDRAGLTESGVRAVPALLGAGLVPDDSQTYELVSEWPFAERERYFTASAKLASYVVELPLSSDDLESLMRSAAVEVPVKRAVVDDVDFVTGRLSRRGAIAICRWAQMGHTLSLDLVFALTHAKAPAELVLGVLEPHLGDIDQAQLDGLLLALGSEYEPLTRSGRHRPLLKNREGTVELLEELKRRNRVSSYRPAKWNPGLRVSMRH